MKTVLHPWQMLLLILAGWINQQQQHAIEYLIAENRILREKIGKKRILEQMIKDGGWPLRARFWEGKRWPRYAASLHLKPFFAGTGRDRLS
jgi:hypothetical protein